MAILSGLDPDPIWSVRAAIASVLGTLPADIALPGLLEMLAEKDQRVIPAVLEALVKLRPPNLAEVLLRAPEGRRSVAVRAAAADGLGGDQAAERPTGARRRLSSSVSATALYSARAAALAALAKYGAPAATPVLTTALADKDWAIRLRAALLLKQLDPSAAADVDRQIRPAPTAPSAPNYQTAHLVNPPVSTAGVSRHRSRHDSRSSWRCSTHR